MNRRSRRALLVWCACGVSIVAAWPAASAVTEERPPTVRGPLIARGHNCRASPRDGAHSCLWIYGLDPQATTAPSKSWQADWATDRAGGRATAGFCLTAAADALTWTIGERPGPAPVHVYPPVGSTAVAAGQIARLVVNAAGRAKVPASLAQRTTWTPGTVTSIPAPGQLVVVWQGRTTGRVSFTLAVERGNVVNSEFGLTGSQSFELAVPCSHAPPAGRGYLARVAPAVVAPGETAWLQVRIPGVLPRFDPRAAKYIWPRATATVTVLKDGVVVGAPQTYDTVGGRYAAPLRYPPGSYVVRVTLRGPTTARAFSLPLRFR